MPYSLLHVRVMTALCVTWLLIGATGACQPKRDAKPHLSTSVQTDESVQPPDMRALSARVADDTAHDHEVDRPDDVAAPMVLTADVLMGRWLLDAHETAKKLPVTESRALVPMLQDIRMGFLFEPHGALTFEGEMLGNRQKHEGYFSFESEEPPYGTLTLVSSKQRDVQDNPNAGPTRILSVEMIDDDHLILRELPDDPDRNVPPAGRMTVMVLQRASPQEYDDAFARTP